MWKLIPDTVASPWHLLKDTLQGKVPLGKKRSAQWRNVRAAHLKAHPTCAVCGGTKTLEVHHIEPFHTNPTKELDPDNLITLCEAKRSGITCHQFVGHMGNYKWTNERVREDVEYIRGRLNEARIRNKAETPPLEQFVEELKEETKDE
jgi:5-methylcytosine-specific restriction protein A